MTSISQPAIPTQISSNQASSQQTTAPAPSSSSATSHGRTVSQAAGSAAAKSSYASATKKPFSPPPGPSTSSTQHGTSDTNSSVNGKVAIPPAVPAVGTPTIVNGNTPTSSSGGSGDLGQKPSVTISASGPQQYAQNGASVGAKSSSGIQFGSYNRDGSPRVMNASLQQPNHSSASLGVHNLSNPRITSPANSPSPIPQPPASGGKPPSHGQNLSVNFGNSGANDPNVSSA